MEKPEFKRESGIVEIKGGNESERTEALDHFELKFKNQEVGKYAREKTPEELKFIQELNDQMERFIAEFGGTALEIKPDNIHIVDYGKLNQQRRKAVAGYSFAAYYSPMDQGIGVLLSDNTPRLIFARVLVHEMMHFNSFQSVIIRKESSESDGTLKPKRTGLNAYPYKEDSYSLFRDIDEAVTEELVKRFDKRFFDTLTYTAEDAQKRNKFIEELKADETKDQGKVDDIYFYKSEQLEDGSFKTTTESYQHRRERDKLWSVIDEIYLKSSGEFKDKEEIFNIFARAAMNGDMKPLTLLVERTLGPGSFKRLGEETRYGAKTIGSE